MRKNKFLQLWLTPILALGFPIGLGYNVFIRNISYIILDQNKSLLFVGLTHLLAIPFIFRRVFAPFRRISFPLSFLFLISGSLICALSQNNIILLFIGSLIGSTGSNIIESLSGFFCKKNYTVKAHQSLFKGNVTLGYRAGSTITKTLIILAGQHYGWSFSFILSTIFFGLCYLFISKTDLSIIAEPLKEKPVLKKFFASKHTRHAMFVSFIFLLPNFIYESMITPFARQKAFSWASLAVAKGVFGTAGAFLGSQIGIWISKAHKSSLYIKILLIWNSLCHATPLIFDLANTSDLYFLYFLANTNHACMIGLFLIFSVFLSQNYKDYDFFMSLSYVAFAAGGCLGGLIASQGSLPLVFALTSLLSLSILKTKLFHFK